MTEDEMDQMSEDKIIAASMRILDGRVRVLTDSIASDTTLLGYTEILERYTPGLTINTLRSMQHRGHMPPSALVGRRRMWRESDIAAWVKACFADAT